jgi:DNA-binding NtrC family response regulator
VRAAGDVLVVDDDGAILTMLVELLEDEGYIVRSAPDAVSSLAALGARLPALILLDYWLPGGSETVIDWVKEHHPDLPIALITASSFTDDVRQDEGLVACLVKPFDIDELLDCVQRYVMPRAQWPEAK